MLSGGEGGRPLVVWSNLTQPGICKLSRVLSWYQVCFEGRFSWWQIIHGGGLSPGQVVYGGRLSPEAGCHMEVYLALVGGRGVWGGWDGFPSLTGYEI